MAMTTYDDIWLAVLDYCKTQISKTGFSLWIEPLKLTDFNDNTVTLMLIFNAENYNSSLSF